MTISRETTLKLHETDNVVVLLQALKGIPAGHKMACAPITKGSAILKYGQIIGFAATDIAEGSHVHIHNVEVQDYALDYAVGTQVKPTDFIKEIPTFMGYRRPSGKAGTRNYVAILSTVNCSATAVQNIAKGLNEIVQKNYPNIDGVVPITHGQGCSLGASGYGSENLQRVLGGYCRHPNFCFTIIVGLGCETLQIARLMKEQGLETGDYLKTMTIQGTGGLRKTIAAGIAQGEALLQEANQARREEISASELILALQCGGSDGYSGITANPALGKAVDQLVAFGGSAILAETPEIYGAEHLLTRRAVSKQVADKLLDRIKWWESYTSYHGGAMNNNPSHGNKAGGITTIMEKSLGAVAKGGGTNLCAVYEYGEPVTEKGFVFMDSPGNDPISITGEVASGANIVCFTTGRGSVYGCKPAPSIKLCTNSRTYSHMIEDMDINCGDILDEGVSIEAKGTEIMDTILRVASGERTKSEQGGLGDYEFIPWQIGAIM